MSITIVRQLISKHAGLKGTAKELCEAGWFKAYNTICYRDSNMRYNCKFELFDSVHYADYGIPPGGVAFNCANCGCLIAFDMAKLK